MFRPLSVYIGTRYTRAKRRSHLISFISLTSMIGLALGVLVMMVVLSVMNGFDHELRTRVLGMVPHATLESYQPIKDWRKLGAQLKVEHPQVLEVAPFIQMQGLLSHAKVVQKVLINAVDPNEESKVSIIGDFFKTGSLHSLKPGEFGILLGDKAAKNLGLQLGDKVTFIAPEVSVTPAGIFPRMKRFTLVGTFHVGAGELDGYVGMVHVEDAARLRRLQPGQVEGLRLKLADLFQAPRTAFVIANSLHDGNDYYARDWTRSHGNLYQAIRMQKSMIRLLLLLIVAVAAFNIISTLVMMVTDKKADIAILRTLGATPKQIMSIFMVQGTVIGVIGTLLGGVLGVLAALNVSAGVAWLERLIDHKFLSADVYFIDYLPSQLLLDDLLMVCGAALILSFLATLYPAWRAARTQPAEALRYE